MDVGSQETSTRSYQGQAGRADYVRLAAPRPPIGVTDIVGALRRRWRWPVVGFLIGSVLAIGSVAIVKTPYKSSARILIDRSMNRYLQTNKLVDQPVLDDTDISSQIYLLSSDSVIVPVVRALKLAQDRELMGRSLAGFSLVDSSRAAAEPDGALERSAVEAVLSRLSVVREDVANVINVTFESGDPNKAAEIANAIADAYIETTIDAKMQSTRLVTQWLQQRLIELKQQAAEADRAVREFRKANNLPNDGLGSVDVEFVANVKNQLAAARIAVAEAKERLDRIKRAASGDVLTMISTDALVHPSRSSVIDHALTNSELVRLRAQLREVEARLAEVEVRVGPKHSAAVKLRGQLDTLRRSITAEEARISDSYASEYQIAKARESELAASAAKFTGGNETSTQVRELENAADTLRTLYNGFLQKYKEISATQAETLPIQAAHIITRAAPPLSKSSKKAIAVFGGSLVLGLLLGAGAAVGRELWADVLRSPKAVEYVTERPCVVLPVIDPQSGSIFEHVLAAPYSRFAESLREVKVSIDAGLPRANSKVIGVVSSLPREGKTVVAANLAALTAAPAAPRTLIVDCDLHLRKLTEALAPGAMAGLLEALDDPSRLVDLVTRLPTSGIDVLPCVSRSRIPNAAELLGSSEMDRLLAVARDHYDYVVLEIPPILSVVDVKVIERLVDAFVFVVEWGQTKRTLVASALASAQVINERIVAVVLNKMDPSALSEIESPKGSRTDDYYQA